MPITASSVTIVPGGQRRHVQAGWYDSRQAFTGPGNDRFGHLVVHNESVIAPASGLTIRPGPCS